MKLINQRTGKKQIGIIEKVKNQDLKKIQKTNQLSFDWLKETGNEIYKIRLENSEKVIGLLSITDIPEELRVHINLIESSKENIGKNKEFENIAGCLIAFACKIAFLKGYDGFVSLIPKTKLIGHYQKQYGFISVGRQMSVFMESSNLLISKYLDNEKI